VTAFTGFDIIILAIVVLSAAFAFSRGLVREALSIAAWVLAAIGAFYAFPYVVPYADRFLPKGAVANAVAALGVFIIALAVLHVIARALASRVKNSPLSTVDRTLGLLFGLARGLVLACVAYMAVAFFMHANEPQPHWLAGSRTIPYLAAGAERLEQLFSRAAHSNGPGPATVEKEAEKAISAFTNPASSPAPHPVDEPLYTPGEQRDLNRLIQQQNSE
jgi:membrane protein required for colicin V production